MGNGPRGGHHGWQRPCPDLHMGGETEAPRKAENKGEEGKQAGVSRAAVLLTLKESRIRVRGLLLGLVGRALESRAQCGCGLM